MVITRITAGTNASAIAPIVLITDVGATARISITNKLGRGVAGAKTPPGITTNTTNAAHKANQNRPRSIIRLAARTGRT